MSAAAAFKAREAQAEAAASPVDVELPSYTISDAGASLADQPASSAGRPVSALSSSSPTASEAGLDIDEDGPPPYSPSTAFVPTVQLQIETSGKRWLSLPGPPRADPIPVYPVDAGGATDLSNPVYLSLRPKRSSGSCTLVRFEDPNGTPLTSTSYFFGPGRYAEVKLGGVPEIMDSKDKKKEKQTRKAGKASPSISPSSSAIELAPTEPSRFELLAEVPVSSGPSNAASTTFTSLPDWASFEIKPVGTFTRAVRFATPLGLFEWRYAGRKERKELGMDSLLVMDHIVRIFRMQDRNASSSSPNSAQMGSSFLRFGRGNSNGGGGSGPSRGGGLEQDEERTPIARFLRSADLRSPGSGPSTAGNGGRLVLDLSKWGENNKSEREAVEVLAVTTVVSMLKKEVDRRRHQQIAIMAAAASGGAA